MVLRILSPISLAKYMQEEEYSVLHILYADDTDIIVTEGRIARLLGMIAEKGPFHGQFMDPKKS